MSSGVSTEYIGPVFPDGREKALSNPSAQATGPSVQVSERSEGGLSDAELAVLATLMYRDDFWSVSGRYLNQDLTIAEALDKFHEEASDTENPEVKEEWSVDDLGGWMTEDEWAQVEATIKENPNLANLKLADVDTYRGGGNQAATFLYRGKLGTIPYVVFRGTNKYEWRDNFKGNNVSDTEQQIRALEYVEFIHAKYGGDITTAGHSKGANKATYTALLSDHVYRAVAFDGQGFSPQFYEKYGHLSEKDMEKVSAYNLTGDYVHSLLQSAIPEGNMHYISSEAVGQNPLAFLLLSLFDVGEAAKRGGLEFGRNHSPIALLNLSNPQHPVFYGEVSTDSDFAKEVNKFSQWIVQYVPPEEQEPLLELLGAFFEDGASQALAENPEGVGVLLATLAEYDRTSLLLATAAGEYFDDENVPFLKGRVWMLEQLTKVPMFASNVAAEVVQRFFVKKATELGFGDVWATQAMESYIKARENIHKNQKRGGNLTGPLLHSPVDYVVRDYTQAKEEEVIQEIRRINALIQEHEQQINKIQEERVKLETTKAADVCAKPSFFCEPTGWELGKSHVLYLDVIEHQNAITELRRNNVLTEAQVRNIFAQARAYDQGPYSPYFTSHASRIKNAVTTMKNMVPHA